MLKACPAHGVVSCAPCAARAAQGRGSTRQWRKVRAAVLARDNNACHWCGAIATHADHLIPKSRGGTDEPSNLVASCAPCNHARGNQPPPPGHAPPRT